MPDAPAATAAPQVQDFLATLPDDLKAAPSITKFKTGADLAKAYTELEKRMGSATSLPAPEAPQAEWDEKVYKKIGWPDAPDKYSRLDPKTAPEDVVVSPEFMDAFYKYAHANRLNNRQANEILQNINNFQLDSLKKLDETSKVQMAEANQKLDALFGQAKPARLEQVRRFLASTAPKEVLDKLEANGWSNDPDVIVYLDKMASQWVEDHSITKNRGIDASYAIPDQIRGRIKEIQATKEYRKGNQKEVDEVARLYDMIYPNRKE